MCFLYNFIAYLLQLLFSLGWQYIFGNNVMETLIAFLSGLMWRRQWHPLQYSCLENPMNGGAWKAAVHGVAGSRTRLSNFAFTFHLHALEKEMSTHSSVLAWRIPGTREPGGLPSMGSHGVGHDWSDLAAAAVFHIPHLLYPFLCRWTFRVLLCKWLLW